jgi:transcriptional regulator with XRE-family HTH domain
MAIRRELTIALAEARVAGRPMYRVAAEAHIDPKTLARIAAGRQAPHPVTREAIARALGRDPAELFCDLEDADASAVASAA